MNYFSEIHTGAYERMGLSHLSRTVNRLVDNAKCNEKLAKRYEGRDMDLYDDIMAILRSEGIYMVDDLGSSHYLWRENSCGTLSLLTVRYSSLKYKDYSTLEEVVVEILKLTHRPVAPGKGKDIETYFPRKWEDMYIEGEIRNNPTHQEIEEELNTYGVLYVRVDGYLRRYYLTEDNGLIYIYYRYDNFDPEDSDYAVRYYESKDVPKILTLLSLREGE